MITTTLDAAQTLGVTQRQVQNAVMNGLLTGQRIGNALAVYERQVFALRRMKVSGRRWDRETVVAALDLLSRSPVTTLQGSQLSRLKAKLRTMSDAELAGRVLAGNVTLYRANAEQQRNIGSALAGQTVLVGAGTSVIVDQDADYAAQSLGLHADPEGNVVALDGNAKHDAVIEALAYTVYGSARERSAGSTWLKTRRSEVFASR
ncbi:hypothetical protein ACXR2W_08240 [Leucobacter sp. HY1908]